jgi:hypothetical protein
METEVTGIEAKICQLIADRQRVGVAKYGQELAENPAPLSERLKHALEESADMTCYLQWAMEKAQEMEAENTKASLGGTP